jgi:hypothetical protein
MSHTVEENDITLLDTLFPQSAGECRDLVEELCVRELLPGARDGAIKVDGNMITVAGKYMAVNAVVAGGDLAIREPDPAVVLRPAGGVSLGVFENGRGLLVPVQMLCLVSPKLLRLVEAVAEDLVLDVILLGCHDVGFVGLQWCGI